MAPFINSEQTAAMAVAETAVLAVAAAYSMGPSSIVAKASFITIAKLASIEPFSFPYRFRY